MIRVIIVEDDLEMLKGAQAMLKNNADIEIAGIFSSAEEFMKQSSSLNMNVVLMDIGLPALSGIECVIRMKPELQKVQFLMWTTFSDDEKIFSALRAGASGYILKNSTAEQLIQAIHEIHNGGSPMSADIARKVITSFHESKPAPDFDLSKRETEILNLLAKGFRYKEIAAKLFISPETVRTHIRNIYEKLQVNSRTDALNKVFPR